MQTIAVGGAKGGVGRSTIAANLAVLLSNRGVPTLLFDACYAEGDIARALNLEPHTDIRAVLDGDRQLAELLVEGPAGLKVIASRFGDIEMSRLSQIDHALLIALFSSLPVPVDTLLVDTPSGISDANASYTSAAREVLLVTTGETASIEATALALGELNTRFGRRRFRVLVNRVESTSHGRDVFSQLLREIGTERDVVLDHVGSIPEDTRVSEARSQCETVVQKHPRSSAAQAFAKLGERVTRWSRPSAPTGHIEFFVERLVQAANTHRVRATA